MAEKLTPQPDIEIVRDLLSPYLDDEVTDEERALVNAALADWPELRDELDSLRQMVAMVAQLPHIPAPRPFTLTQADVQAVAPKAKKSWGLPAWFGGFAAAAALLVCVLAVGGLFWTSQNGGGMVGDIAMAPQQAVEEAAMEQPAEEPAPAAKEMPLEEAAEAELLVETVEVEQEAAKEVVVEEKAEEAPNLAPAQATGTAGLLADTDTARSAGEESLGMQALLTPTPAPSSTTTPGPALAAPAAPGEARDAISSEESATVEKESPPPEGESAAAKASGASIPTAQDDVAPTAEAAQPTATAIALLTLLPPETPQATPAPSEPAPETPPAAAPLRTSFVIGIIFILIILVVIAVGFIIWRARH